MTAPSESPAAPTKRLYDHVHGQINRLCTHPDCQRAWARRNKQWKLNASRGIRTLLDDPAVLDQVATHIQQLEIAGWSRRAIAAAAGLSATAVSRLGNHRQTHIRGTTAAAILKLDPADLPHRASRGVTEPFVSKRGAVRRIQALLAIGWTHRLLAEHTGVQTAVVLNQPGRWITRSTHDRLAAAYRDLATRPGPSHVTRARAAKLGYLSPLAWNDIDRDPHPDGDTDDDPGNHHDQVDPVVVDRVLAGERLTTTRAEKEAITAAWTNAGRSLRQLEQLTGWKTDRYTRPAPTGDTAA